MALFSSCDKGIAPNDEVGVAAAFGHVTTTGSYWVGIGIALVICAAIAFAMFKAYQKGGDINITFIAVIVAIMMFAILMRPCELGVNTSVEQAARGVWIGY